MDTSLEGVTLQVIIYIGSHAVFLPINILVTSVLSNFLLKRFTTLNVACENHVKSLNSRVNQLKL